MGTKATSQTSAKYPEVEYAIDLPLATTKEGKIYVVLTSSEGFPSGFYYSNGTSWTYLIDVSGGAGLVLSVNGKTGVVTLNTSEVPEATDYRYLSDIQKTSATREVNSTQNGLLSSEDWLHFNRDLYFSVGAFTIPELIDNGDGTATISSLDVNLYSSVDYTGKLERYTLAEQTITFTPQAEEYVVADYNNGSPIIRKETNKFLINGSSIFTLLICWRQDGTVHSIAQGAIALGLSNKLDRALYNTVPYRRSVDGGLILSISETPTPRTVIVSSAIVYGGSTPITVGAFNSSTDLLTRVAHVSGVWVYEARTVYGNSNYDDGTNVVPLGDYRWANRFFYRSIGDAKEVFYTLGSQEFFNEDDTHLELPPTPPILLRDHCIYIGRIAVSKDSDMGVVHPAFDFIEEFPEKLTYQSAGVRVLPEITTGVGTITVGIGEYLLYNDDTFSIEGLNKYTIGGNTFTLSEGVVNYVVANYNSGTPEIQLIVDVNLINESSVIPIVTCYNVEGSVLTLNWDQLGKGLVNKLNQRLVKTRRFELEPSSCILGEKATRYVTLTSGKLWYGGANTVLDAIDTSSPTQDIAFYYSVNGVWTRAIIDQYNNTQYNAVGGLVTLNPNKYAVNWVYRGISNDSSSVVIVLGTDNYSLGEAQDSKPPVIPPILSNFTILVGRIIVEKDADIATQIDSAFVSDFIGSGITDHNALSNLQGGEVDKYFHSNQEINILSTPEFADVNITGLSGNIITSSSVETSIEELDSKIYNKSEVTKEPTGFETRQTSIMSFDSNPLSPTFLQFTIASTVTSFNIWSKNNKFIKTASTVSITNTLGLWYIYFSTTGVLSCSQTEWNFVDGNAPVATVYWDGITALISDERHGVIMDGMTHAYLHYTVGVRYELGLAGSWTDTTFSISDGYIIDEDIRFYITPDQTQCRVFYRESGFYKFTAPQTKYYVETDNILQWDNNGALAPLDNNRYMAMWFFATNNITEPIWVLTGQRQDTTLALARTNNSYQNLVLLTLPSQEMKLLYRVIIQRSGTSEVFIEAEDYRSVSNLPSGNYVATNHSSLTGLTADDHPQYSLVNGTRDFTGIIQYDSDKTFTTDQDIISKKYVDDEVDAANQQSINFSLMLMGG